MLAILVLLTLGDSTYARAESLLAHHHLSAARRIAEKLVAQHPNDEEAHLLLGRILLIWPTIGRYPALEQFKTAAHLAPADPEPIYHESEVGMALKGDDGDRLARESFLRLFTLAPDYGDSWQRFRLLYQDENIWRDGEKALASHPDDPLALVHRAELALDLGEALTLG
jgi:tetratricopeptide (TPR) repeat protein